MRLMMFVVVSGSLAFRTVLAQPAVAAPDLSSAAAECKEVAAVPADAAIGAPALAAKISLASCGAGVRFAALKLAADDASIRALSEAAKPSLELLDAVVAANDATLSPIAAKVKAGLLVGMAVRLRSSIPPVTMANLAEHDRAHAELEPKIKAWLDAGK